MDTKHVLSAVALCVISQGLVWAQGGKPAAAAARFPIATVHLEQNASDGDGEVVFEIMGADDGLSTLTVKAPDGRVVVDFTASDPKTMGMRQFRFESPEPRDMKALKAAYPEGTYTFDGATASGVKLHSTVMLSHTLPLPVSKLKPGDRAGSVAIKNMAVSWAPVAGAAAYVVYIEQADSNVTIEARLPGSMSTFMVPEGFLQAGKAYQLGVGSIADKGNASFLETTFTTAKP
jgi:hypothetical protein